MLANLKTFWVPVEIVVDDKIDTSCVEKEKKL